MYVWLDRRYKELLKRLRESEPKLNMSLEVRKMLERLAAERGIEIPPEDPDIIMKVKCPYCGWLQNTSSFSYVTCFRCGKRYRIFYKRGPSNVVEIVKGTQQDVIRKLQELGV